MNCGRRAHTSTSLAEGLIGVKRNVKIRLRPKESASRRYTRCEKEKYRKMEQSSGRKNMNVTKEMQLLRDKLDEMGVKWIDASDCCGNLVITRTWFRDKEGTKWSAIHGFGTIGGYNGMRADEGLLEIWNRKSEPIGYLTAAQVIAIVFERKAAEHHE